MKRIHLRGAGRRLLVTAALAVGVTAVVPTTGTSAAAPTLADVLLADKASDDANGFDRRLFDYDIVTQAILLFPDLTAAAANPNATLTAFLPNDAAFYRLVRELTGSYPRSEKAAFDAVASLGRDTVKLVLSYHIFGGGKIDYRTALRSDNAVLPMLAGGNVTVDVKPFFGFRFVELVDNDRNDANPIVVQPNVGGAASNGFAHGISLVLRPSDLP
jgi:hypothetical protein